MPALWSLKCSRVAAISISLAPATDRKLDWVQSSRVIQLTSVNLSLCWAPFGTAQQLKIITFILGKAWTRATRCFSIKYARGYFWGVWDVRSDTFQKRHALAPRENLAQKMVLNYVQLWSLLRAFWYLSVSLCACAYTVCKNQQTLIKAFHCLCSSDADE